MTKELKLELKKRALSLLWRAGAFIVAGVGAMLLEPGFLNTIGVPVFLVAGTGLVIGEITKAANNYLNR